jgi:hypothetical protein
MINEPKKIIHKNTKHGWFGTKLYQTWANMKRRCFNKNDKNFSRWGGRGITVCDEWMEFVLFKDWALSNGYDESLSIDRIDNNGNYEPSNCRWTTRAVQSRNQNKPSNNTTGFKGVHRSRDKFRARIRHNEKYVNIGTFKTAEEASIAYDAYICINNLEHKPNKRMERIAI